MASVNTANFLSRSFIGFLCKPRNISLFLSSIFLSTIFFLYLSLNHLPTPFFLQVPLDPVGAGPQQFYRKWLAIGEGNGNPLQCSCLENPRDGGAWWAVLYGVAQSRTWLKWHSSREWKRALWVLEPDFLSSNHKSLFMWECGKLGNYFISLCINLITVKWSEKQNKTKQKQNQKNPYRTVVKFELINAVNQNHLVVPGSC